ncbi:unnamed protein product [Schistosoma intercalatum]|nr:unnamed protein product [Schistosoma intercalatum]CAH8451423.1 unnamed protein product [Schistosoma intercalatum]
MNKCSTWNILSITALVIYCLLISLTNSWKIGTTRIPNDNEEIRMELENTPIMYEEIEPTLKQKQKWISQTSQGDLPWIHGLNRAGVNRKPYNTLGRERRFFCNPMGCV